MELKTLEKVEMSADGIVNVSAEKAWDLFNDFGDLSWYGPMLKSCHLEGDGTAGSKRTVKIKGFGNWSEILDFIDYKEKIIKYTLLDGHPFPFKNYSGLIKVSEKGANRCYIKWEAKYEVEASKVKESKNLIKLIIDKGIERIRKIFE